ncbi:hypothetical protein [Rosistilla ulvae]|uniref:hypothetical protein n=1 Tax=Rosistilla ulvae TaxID=1930277 RepID=UPI00119E187F|nr:hypothetical protein [Rosistilla ulvae]
MDTPDGPIEYDTSYLNSLRELKFVVVIGSIALAWTLIYGGWKGYSSDPEAVEITLGMPSWVFWGIAIPWCVTSMATLGFALFVLREDDDDLLEQEAQAQAEAASKEDAS